MKNLFLHLITLLCALFLGADTIFAQSPADSLRAKHLFQKSAQQIGEEHFGEAVTTLDGKL